MITQLVAIVQARTNSTRLPGKVLKHIAGRPLLEFLVERLRRCKEIDQIVIATTLEDGDDQIVHLSQKLNLKCFRGPQDDVLKRYILASEESNASHIIRITADCPLVDPVLISKLISFYKQNNFDYVSNTLPPTFPDGLDLELFSRKVLLLADKECTDISLREHVTTWIRENGELSLGNFEYPNDYSDLRLTVDHPEDLEVINNIVTYFKNSSNFSWEDILQLYKSDSSLFQANNNFSRNEGTTISTGQKLWRRAKKVIPGGNMLLSKRSELFLPDKWPAYFSKAKGCRVWDLDNKEFIDMSIMGIGTNILGYGHPEVDEAVSKVIRQGNMSTLNCPEEVLLAEKLVELHPWSGKVRFARSGGEANSIAIRIARAASGKDTVAICGYHGWHDWYLATNIKDSSNLEEHLLPGLEANGVPKALQGSVKPFSYNRYDQLEKIALENDLAAVKMEVQRSDPPQSCFLEKVRRLCDKRGIILIFDECTSGFRECLGGLHKKYKVEPDMAMFGKALGNGYAITAVIGKNEIMEAVQSTFISSTFWTERIGPTAALKTIEVMEKEKSWEYITNLGIYLRQSWQELADNYKLKIKHVGLPSLTGFLFNSPHQMNYKTFITQEMLKEGYLAANSCYLSTAHTSEILDRYIECLDVVFSKIAQHVKYSDKEIPLSGPVCHSGFKRLNSN